MAKRKKKHKSAGSNRSKKTNPAAKVDNELRIIGGRFRRSRLKYSGLDVTRPMKDRIRESVFNLLGKRVEGKLAIDLFAGTGALGLEAISRGSKRAIFIERHFPTVDVLKENVAHLDIASLVEIFPSDTFYWWKQQTPEKTLPWLVFCSPPYAFFEDRRQELMTMLAEILQAAPEDSLMVIEADPRLSMETVPHLDDWDFRKYGAIQIGIYHKSAKKEI
ncbi:Ribosomal RNA small subunit methyltransferase D [Planctomycetales bacterium 10988]|nr:Ribosomal RNA small subunit methyltransferase D [Planctomycetales bacterium 10988]